MSKVEEAIVKTEHTAQQIEDFCKSRESRTPDGSYCLNCSIPFESVRIIRQLQSRTDLNHCLSCDAMGGPDGCCGILEWKENGEVVCNACGLKWNIKPFK